MRTAYIYIRVSTDEQAVKGYSMRMQEENLINFCRINNLIVSHVVREDHSAKTFDRPEWKCMLKSFNQAKTTRPNLILFTRWDRFSRNAGDAYYMIALLKKMDIEVQAIEQMLDLTIPENKLVLALYLAVSEVENDRRALNIKKALYKARQEGRWIGPAPKGYINKTTETGKKEIVASEPEATVIRQIFSRIAQGDISVREAHRYSVALGFNCSLNNFWCMIRNPVYCGKIKVPEFENVKAYLVLGQHESLISEELFDKVQGALVTRARTTPIRTENINFPFKGILLCPSCKRVLTGSVSKGNRAYYAYYHCYNGCKFRIRASIIDEQFNDFLHELKPTQVIVDLFRIILKTTLELDWKESAIKQNQITKNIEHLFDRSIKAKELLLKGEIEDEDFRVIKTDCELKVNSIGKDLQQVAQQIITVQKELDNEAAKISHIDKVYSTAPFEIKKKIIKLLFKEKVVPNDDTFRKSEQEHISIIFNKKKIFQGVAPLKNFDCQTELNYDEKNKYYCNELLKQLAVNQSKLSSMFWSKFLEITDFLEKLAIILHLQPFN